MLKQTVEKSAKKKRLKCLILQERKQQPASVCIIFKINVEVTCKVWVPRRSRSLHDASTASPQACGHITMRARGAQRLSASYPKSFGGPNSAPETQEIWQKQNTDISTFFFLNSNVCLGKTRDEDTVWRVTCIKHERFVRARWAPSAALE